MKGALEEIVDFCFEGGNSDGIYIENGKAFWRKPKRGEYRTYTKVDIKKVLKFVMNNAYFQVNNQVFQQVIGIPMGSDPAPFIANLFLYFYESKFLDKLKKEDLHRARRLRHVFRFIDDLIALNDNNEFAASYKEIYPEEMELKPENVDHSSSSYLDLQIDVDDKQFDFKLLINAMPSLSLLFVCLIYKVTCLLRCFTLQSVQRFFEFVELLLNIPISF